MYFFEDGEGLPLKSLDNSSYAEIKTMCTLYDWPTADLTQRYLQLLDPAAEVAPATAPPPILTPSPGPKAAAANADGGTGDGGEDDDAKARKAAERRSNKLALKRSEEMHVRGPGRVHRGPAAGLRGCSQTESWGSAYDAAGDFASAAASWRGPGCAGLCQGHDPEHEPRTQVGREVIRMPPLSPPA